MSGRDEVARAGANDAIVIPKGAMDALHRALFDAVTEADWDRARGGFGDPDLAGE